MQRDDSAQMTEDRESRLVHSFVRIRPLTLELISINVFDLFQRNKTITANKNWKQTNGTHTTQWWCGEYARRTRSDDCAGLMVPHCVEHFRFVCRNTCIWCCFDALLRVIRFLCWFVAAVKSSPNKYEGFLCPTESGNGWLPVEIASSSVRYEIEISHWRRMNGRRKIEWVAEKVQETVDLKHDFNVFSARHRFHYQAHSHKIYLMSFHVHREWILFFTPIYCHWHDLH